MAASSGSLPCATATNAPAPILRSFFMSNSSCFQPCCLRQLFDALARYSAGVSSFGGSTVSSRHSRLPSACALSGAKIFRSAKPYSSIFCSGLRSSFFLCTGSSAPFTHAPYTASPAARLRCASSPSTAMPMLLGFSPSSNCKALRTCTCCAKVSFAKSSIAHATSAPFPALAATGDFASSSAFMSRRASTALSRAACGRSLGSAWPSAAAPAGAQRQAGSGIG